LEILLTTTFVSSRNSSRNKANGVVARASRGCNVDRNENVEPAAQFHTIPQHQQQLEDGGGGDDDDDTNTNQVATIMTSQQGQRQ